MNLQLIVGIALLRAFRLFFGLRRRRNGDIVREAFETGGSVYDLYITNGWLTRDNLNELLKPKNMTHPRLNR